MEHANANSSRLSLSAAGRHVR